MTHDLWEGLNDTIVSYLASVTLGQLINNQKEKLRRSTSQGVAAPLLDHRKTANLSH